jgi:hypothetical protein
MIAPNSTRRTLTTRIAVVLSALAAACAGNSTARRASAITAADRAAQRIVASEASLDVAKIPARAFAVLPFTPIDSATTARDTVLDALGFGLASLLTTDLSVSPSLQLVERARSDAILRELKLVDDGITDPKTAPRVGRLIGARRVLVGDAFWLDAQHIALRARLVDVISGTVEELVRADAPLDRVLDAEKALALQLFERLGITLTPAQRLRVERRQSTQLAAIVAFGRGVQADARGDAAVAIKSYETAVRADTKFAAAKATLASATIADAGPRAGTTTTNLSRALELGSQALNTPITTKTSDVAAAPFVASGGLSIIFTIRVTP